MKLKVLVAIRRNQDNSMNDSQRFVVSVFSPKPATATATANFL